MSTTPILKIPQVATNQAGKEATINDALGLLEASTNKTLVVDISAGDVELDEEQVNQHFAFAFEGATNTQTVTLPVGTVRFILAINRGAWSVNVECDGESVVVPANGTLPILVGEGAVDVVNPPAPEVPQIGEMYGKLAKPTVGGDIMARYLFPRAGRIPAGTYIRLHLIEYSASANDYLFRVGNSGAPTYALSVAASGEAGSYLVTDDIPFSAGDMAYLIGPNPADAHAANPIVAFSYILS